MIRWLKCLFGKHVGSANVSDIVLYNGGAIQYECCKFCDRRTGKRKPWPSTGEYQ